MSKEPRVGFFWLHNSKLVTDSTPLPEAEPYGRQTATPCVRLYPRRTWHLPHGAHNLRQRRAGWGVLRFGQETDCARLQHPLKVVQDHLELVWGLLLVGIRRKARLHGRVAGLGGCELDAPDGFLRPRLPQLLLPRMPDRLRQVASYFDWQLRRLGSTLAYLRIALRSPSPPALNRRQAQPTLRYVRDVHPLCGSWCVCLFPWLPWSESMVGPNHN